MSYAQGKPSRQQQRPPRSRKKRFLFYGIYLVLLIAITLPLGEMMARLLGHKPWTSARDTNIRVEPSITFFTEHPTLGFAPRGGRVKFISPGRFEFSMTKLDNGLRITHPLETYHASEKKKEVWIFGCSFTQGWFLADNETYPWLLQEKLPRYEVVNYGVSGYGTLQSLIQLREALSEGKRPELVIVAYAGFHDQRNTLTRIWRKNISMAVSDIHASPYARLDWHGRLEISRQPLEYHGFPLRERYALAHALEKAYDNIAEHLYESHDVSKAILKEMLNLCRANGIKFVVAGISREDATADMLEYCHREGIPATDISIDLNIKENNNLPYDAHPSAVADRQYEQKLESFLCEKFIETLSCAK
ncbi:MAG: hypothetical protein WBP93_19215 [Pyrinomonadaceae bacterium]